MEGERVAASVAGSAGALLRYMEDMQWVTDPPIGMSETEVTSVGVRDGYAVLHLASRLADASGLILRVGSRVLDEGEAGFTRYDEISRTIVVRPGEDVLGEMSEGARVTVLTDMKFLVAAVGDFYKRYGGWLRLPDGPPGDAEPIYPGEPTGQQAMAAETVIGNSLSYVWGAPGTGKTQFVLAACIRGCLARGERVAVFAPTNNSVEQVLRGVLGAFGDDVPEGVVRLGVPTREFLRDHPEMCEDRQSQSRMDMCMRSVSNLEEVLYERRCDAVRRSVERLCASSPSFADPEELAEDSPELAGALADAMSVAALRPSTEGLFGRGIPVSESARALRTELYERERPATAVTEYDEWTDSEIASRILEVREEISRLRERSTGNRVAGAPIVAGTPQQFISRFRPRGSPEDGRIELDVDRVFIDEAGYCGLVQALALFTNGVPVAMFGDHMQLPPVCQVDDALLAERAQSGGAMSEVFLWNMSALHCEGILASGIGRLRELFLSGGGPDLSLTARADLTASRRFGESLARVLDLYVYGNGMTGSGSEMSIECIDAACGSRDTRENPGEAAAIADLLRRERPDPADVCVLSPYSAQCRLLRSMVGRRYADCVMTVHGSQGREWDTVIISVADNGSVNRDVPLRFTSSSTPMGKRVVNTAVSRARRRLVVVCDVGFWSAREGELVRGLIEAADSVTRLPGRCRGRPGSASAAPSCPERRS